SNSDRAFHAVKVEGLVVVDLNDGAERGPGCGKAESYVFDTSLLSIDFEERFGAVGHHGAATRADQRHVGKSGGGGRIADEQARVVDVALQDRAGEIDGLN